MIQKTVEVGCKVQYIVYTRKSGPGRRRRGGEERETRELNSRPKNRREEAVRIKDMRKGYKMEDGSPGRSAMRTFPNVKFEIHENNDLREILFRNICTYHKRWMDVLYIQ